MGFEVYDYAGGLEDWANAGAELAGDRGGGRPLLMSLLRDVPTLPLDATVGDAKAALDDGFLLVVDDDRVVLGKVLARSLAQEGLEDPAEVATLLVEGPTTVRPTEHLPALLERMQRAGTSSVVVTSNQGEYLGVLRTDDAERAVDELRREHQHAHGDDHGGGHTHHRA